MRLNNSPEFRVLIILGIIALSAHLLTLFGSVLAHFIDIIFLLILSWLIALVLEPLVIKVSSFGLSKVAATILVYLGLTILIVVPLWLTLPQTISQLTQLLADVNNSLSPSSPFGAKIVSQLETALAGSGQFIAKLATAAGSLLLLLVLSAYFLISREQISGTIKKLVPDEYEDDYTFLEKVLRTTFASFVRIQILLGLILGAVSFVTLLILQSPYAFPSAVLSTILGAIPVAGPILFLIPVILALVTISVQKTVIATIVVILASQLVFNILLPKLFSDALKIHPIVVLLSFVVGFKVGGVWGAIFSVPVASAIAIIGAELFKYWHQEADK